MPSQIFHVSYYGFQTYICESQRAVFELGRESGEIVEDSEHEDTGGHHTSNLIINSIIHIIYTEEKRTNMKKKLLI